MGLRPHRTLLLLCILATVASSTAGFGMGVLHARHVAAVTATDELASRAALVKDVKRELTSEMGLVPVSMLRDRRSSFVELYAYDSDGKTHYGTAGYLG